MTDRAPLHEFQPYGKTPRLNKQITVTEKIDGSNCAVMIRPLPANVDCYEHETVVRFPKNEGGDYSELAVGAQSRNRLIKPGKQSDNAGFAAWVWDNAYELVRGLGVGRHFGEWWGPGVQFDYGIEGKRFSLFNPFTFGTAGNDEVPSALAEVGVRVVPLLLQWGHFDSTRIDGVVTTLVELGSAAAALEGVSGAKAEGVIVRHSASGQLYKRLIENDDIPKGLVPA